jgi:hypothetical protein
MRAGFIHDGNICVLEEIPADRPHRLSIRLRKVGPHVLQDGEKVLATGQAEVAVMGGWSSRSCITSIPAGYGDYTLTDRRLWVEREIRIPQGRPAPGPRAFGMRQVLKIYGLYHLRRLGRGTSEA